MNVGLVIRTIGVVVAAVLPGGSLVLGALMVSRWLRARKLLPAHASRSPVSR